LQTLISNFDALGKTKKIPTMVEKILKPGCVIFHITESDPLSTLKSLVQRARELLHMKEHPHAFSRTTAIEMLRESERANRRSEVHKMMADVYASKPTWSQNPYDYETDPSFGEAMTQAEARAEEAKRVAAAKRRSDVHKMMAAAYASNPTLSQKTQFKMQSASEMRPDFHPKFRSFAAWNVANPYDYGTYTPFGEALEEAEAMAIADAFVNPKPKTKTKTKRCSMMGGRIKRKSKKRNSVKAS
jgi:hypothetical protein